MDSLVAFAMGCFNRDRELMVFDWEKAADLIRKKKPKCAEAGLQGDWEWTGGTIFANGEPVMNDYTFLASTWATPMLEMEGEAQPCYRMQSKTPGWGAHTKWPESAMEILHAMEVSE